MAEEVSISSVSPSFLETQVYSSQDINLLNEFELSREFGAEQDIIEYHIFDSTNNLLSSSYNYTSYSMLWSHQRECLARLRHHTFRHFHSCPTS